MRGRLIILVMALAAVAIAFAASGDKGEDGDAREASPRAAQPAAGALRLSFPYSPEK